jgi:ribosomal protein S27AE
LSKQRCPSCGGDLVDGVIIGGTMWTDSRTRFIPARYLSDRTLFGRYRREVPTAARACQRCGVVTLFVNPGMLDQMVKED